MTFSEYAAVIADSPETPAPEPRAAWVIGRRWRTATLNGCQLQVANHRDGILGPVRWWVRRGGDVVASGGVFRGKRYIAMTREAMRQAEAAALMGR